MQSVLTPSPLSSRTPGNLPHLNEAFAGSDGKVAELHRLQGAHEAKLERGLVHKAPRRRRRVREVGCMHARNEGERINGTAIRCCDGAVSTKNGQRATANW